MFHVTRDLMVGTKELYLHISYITHCWNKTCMYMITIPFFIPSFLFIYPFYNQALNLNLNNLKFTFVFFYLLHSTSRIFGSIASMYLTSADDGICINTTKIMLLIEEFGNIFKLFIKTSTWSDAG